MLPSKHSATYELHSAIIGIENLFTVFFRVAVLHRFYCTILTNTYLGLSTIYLEKSNSNEILCFIICKESKCLRILVSSHFSLGNFAIAKRERVGCFTLIVSLLSHGCLYSESLLHGAMGWVSVIVAFDLERKKTKVYIILSCSLGS